MAGWYGGRQPSLPPSCQGESTAVASDSQGTTQAGGWWGREAETPDSLKVKATWGGRKPQSHGRGLSSVCVSSHRAQNSPEGLSHLIPEVLDWTQRSPLNTSLEKVLQAKKILAHCLGI